MSKVERKEYQQTRIMRSSTNQNAGYDNNLDDLLADLQNTVSRPGSSLDNNNTLESRNVSIRNRMESTNPVMHYSTSDTQSFKGPEGAQRVQTTKKEAYSYKSTGVGGPPEKVRMQNNINQLDTLLDDLQQVKEVDASNQYKSISGYQEYNTNKKASQRTMERGFTSEDYKKSLSSERSSSKNSYHDMRHEGYGELKPASPLPSRSNTSTLSKQTRVGNVQTYPLQVVETTTSDINPEILASLDPELLPSGNTKVTTTIKTYTYEIPASTEHIDIERNINTLNSSNQTIHSTPSKSFVYNKHENDTLTRSYNTNNIEYVPSPVGNQNVITETVTTRNYQPGKVNYPEPSGKQTYIYNESTTTRNVNDHYNRNLRTPPPKNQEPTGKQTYIYNETTTTRNVNDPYNPNTRSPRPKTPDTYVYERNVVKNNIHHRPDSPDHGHLPPVTTTIHKFDSMTNLNARQYPETETFDPKHPPYPPSGSPQNGHPYPYDTQQVYYPNTPPEVNVTYKYKSVSNTSTRGPGYPGSPGGPGYPVGPGGPGYPVGPGGPGGEDEPLLPRKFPTDGADGPPKKIDDLMANIGREPPTNAYNVGWSQHEQELAKQRKIDSLKAQHEYEVKKREEPKDVPKTKNVSGPPVYYPPGHEMFIKKEESGGGAWRAEGAMAREKGMYQYEAESKSKSKSSSGAAIVPVCLPLCCGLPCTII